MTEKLYVLSGAYQWQLRIERYIKSQRLKKCLLPLLKVYSIIVGHPAKLFAVIRHKESQKRHKLAIVAIGKNESEYISEWVVFHKLVGVSHIYLYDNDSTDGMAESLQPFINDGFVDVISFPGQRKQLPAYNNAISRFGKDCKWMAFMDCDEFLMPEKKGDDIVGILDKIAAKDKSIGGIAVNWCMYGSSGYEVKPQGLLTEKFIMRAKINGGGEFVHKNYWQTGSNKKIYTSTSPTLQTGILCHRHYRPNCSRMGKQRAYKIYSTSYKPLFY